VEKKVTWIELFYDLVFVAAFIQLGNGLSANVSLLGFVVFAGVFAPLWVAWSGFTFFENRYTIDDFTHRVLVFGQMFAVGAMAIAAPDVLAGKTRAFSLATAAAFVVVALMHARAYRQVEAARSYSSFWGGVFLVSAGGWLASAFVAAPYSVMLMVASTAAVIFMPLSPQSRELSLRLPIDFEHLAERYGLLTIIVLGESFVKVLGVLVAEGAGVSLYLEGGVTLLITCGLWWIYFDDVAGARIHKGPFQWIVWLYAHIPLQIAVTASGVAIKKAVRFGWDVPAPAKYRWLLAGAVALVLISVSIIDSVTERKHAHLSDRARINARWLSGVVVLLLAPAGRGMSGGLFLVLVMGVVLAQVVFDMMMAPFEQSDHDELGAKGSAELARDRLEGADAAAHKRPSRDISEAVRKGAPSQLRRDLYFYFIEGGWGRVFGSLIFLFLVSNVVFASLFMLEPGSIAGGRPRSFADAFFFSVQTMSSIGYGALTPATVYGNVIVTVEAALSIIAIAIVTGVVFAKVSRPRASVLFSDTVAVTDMHDERTLMFRVGNARGNDVVDATVAVTVMIDEISPEGIHLRRLHELPLARKHTPLFAITWTVMHVIDEDSPFYDVDLSQPLENIKGMLVTLVGHDSTYGQTIYSRKIYDLEAALRVDHSFVDVLSQLADGRMMIDYAKFHDTVPIEPVDDESSASSPEQAV